jgi:hypothetical protein
MMNSILIQINDKRSIDGIIAHVNLLNQSREPGEWLSPESYITAEIENHGRLLADNHRIGTMTRADFILRFITPAEYSAIKNAATSDPQVAALLDEFAGGEASFFSQDDPRFQAGLALLVQAGLLEAHRPAEMMEWPRPHFVSPPEPSS